MNTTTKLLILMLSLGLALTACSSDGKKATTSFDECVAAGNPVMESFPRQCSDGTTTFTEKLEGTYYVSEDPEQCKLMKFMCVEGMRPFFDEKGCGCTDVSEEKACTREFMPVCGEIQVQCVTTPCDPLKTTFANRCEAENAGAVNIVEGECQEEVNLEGACLSFDGAWLEESQECEGMGQEMCEDLGGTFNECASACRNDPDAEMCTMQCVVVCDFS